MYSNHYGHFKNIMGSSDAEECTHSAEEQWELPCTLPQTGRSTVINQDFKITTQQIIQHNCTDV